MALEKSVENSQGVDVTYWKITMINRNIIFKQVTIELYGYVSEETRLSGKDSVESRHITISCDEYDAGFTAECGEVSHAYMAVKQVEEFKDAIDC